MTSSTDAAVVRPGIGPSARVTTPDTAADGNPVDNPGGAAEPGHAASGSEPGRAGQATPATPRRAQRWGLLDVTRLVAALAVVLFHYTAWHHTHWDPSGGTEAAQVWAGLSAVTVFGNLGVQLFFVISGLVVLRSAVGKSTGYFVGSRVGRLMPAFWVAVLFTGSLQMLLWKDPAPHLTWAKVWENLTLAGPPLHGGVWVDGVFWTLWVEVRFYLLLMVVLALLKAVPGPWRERVIVVLTGAWVAWSWLVTAGVLSVPEKVSRWFVPQYAGLFAAGMLLSLIVSHGPSLARVGVLLLAAGQSVDAVVRLEPADTLASTGIAIPGWAYAVAVVLIIGLVAALVLTPLARVNRPWMGKVGALTYPVYLLHQVPGWFLITLLSPHLPKWVVLALVIGAVVLAAWTVHRFVEATLGPRLNHWVRDALDAPWTGLDRSWHLQCQARRLRARAALAARRERARQMLDDARTGSLPVVTGSLPRV